MQLKDRTELRLPQSRFTQSQNLNRPNKPARRERHGENQAYQVKLTAEACAIHALKRSQILQWKNSFSLNFIFFMAKLFLELERWNLYL